MLFGALNQLNSSAIDEIHNGSIVTLNQLYIEIFDDIAI